MLKNHSNSPPLLPPKFLKYCFLLFKTDRNGEITGSSGKWQKPSAGPFRLGENGSNNFILYRTWCWNIFAPAKFSLMYDLIWFRKAVKRREELYPDDEILNATFLPFTQQKLSMSPLRAVTMIFVLWTQQCTMLTGLVPVLVKFAVLHTVSKPIDLSKAALFSPGNEYNPTFGDCLKDLAQSVSHYMWTLLQSSFAMHSSTPLALCLETCFFLLSRSLGPGLPPCLVHFRHPGPDFKSIPGPTFLLISASPWHLPPLSCPLSSHVTLFLTHRGLPVLVPDKPQWLLPPWTHTVPDPFLNQQSRHEDCHVFHLPPFVGG